MCNNGGVLLDDLTEIQSIQKNENRNEETIDCSQCFKIPQAFCLLASENKPNKVRMDFNDMVEKMTKDSQAKICGCIEGYLPQYNETNGALMKCHDPIIKTATTGGRCLVQEHCRGVKNSVSLVLNTFLMHYFSL